MKHKAIHANRFFFASQAMPCPYLSGRVERRVLTELVGDDAAVVHNVLSEAGFRRSHGIAYAPACPRCNACVAVRVVADGFRPSRSQRRVWSANAGLDAKALPPIATDEQYALFTAYQAARHGDGEMAKMTYFDYQALVEDTPVDTTVFEFREPDDGTLVAACLTDHVDSGFSAVYSFFEPGLRRRSLGTYMILWLIDRARAAGLAHVYLGFWIAGCCKMSYKASFQPLEAYTPEGWRPFSAVAGA